MDIESKLKLLVDNYNKNKRVPNNFITRIGNGSNFWNSDRYSIWGVGDSSAKTLEKSAKRGDHIWFCTGSSNGKLVAVATFDRIIKRFNEKDKVSNMLNIDFGWNGEGWNCNYLLKYNNRYNLEFNDICSGIKGSCPTRKVKNRCPTGIDLSEIYNEIINI